jgi:hypothetical protein
MVAEIDAAHRPKKSPLGAGVVLPEALIIAAASGAAH